jgi:hypothetical protein
MQVRNGGSGAAGPPVNVTCGLCQGLQSLRRLSHRSGNDSGNAVEDACPLLCRSMGSNLHRGRRKSVPVIPGRPIHRSAGEFPVPR